MTFKTAICDDEKEGLDYIRNYLQTYHFETGTEFSITTYSSPEEFITDYNKAGIYDIVFLDVEMPGSIKGERGIELAKQIRALPDDDVIIIFVSNYPEYMVYGFDVRASHYLSKGIPFSRFKEIMDNILSHIESDKSILKVKSGRDQIHLLRINEILYVESCHRMHKHVIFKTRNGEQIEENKSLSYVKKELITHGFTTANQYCLVNLRYVRCLKNNLLILDNHDEIPLSRYYKKEFLSIFSKNILKIHD